MLAQNKTRGIAAFGHYLEPVTIGANNVYSGSAADAANHS
jgi:hypothetical protein